MKHQARHTGAQLAWKIVAGVLIALMGGFWLYGQDVLDRMAVTVTPLALVLPPGAAILCGAAWWARNARRRTAGWESVIDPIARRDETLMLAGLFALAWAFAFAMDRLGQTPHQSLASALVASVWDACGFVGIVFCGACWYVGGRR